MKKSIFHTGRPNKRLADAIKITSVTDFKNSIKTLKGKKGYLSLKEFRALQLAKNRCKAALKRKDLSASVRKRFKAIAKISIPYKKQ